MMKLNKKGGFTLIELLVVIAIIGILSSVVLVSLNSARNKGQDAKIQGQVASIRNAAELYYASSTSYANMSNVTNADTSGLYNLTKVPANWPNSVLPFVDSSATGWKASARLISDVSKIACSDSSGFSGVITTATTTGKLCDNSTSY